MMMLWRNMGNRGEKVKNSFKSINMYDIMEPDFLSGQHKKKDFKSLFSTTQCGPYGDFG